MKCKCGYEIEYEKPKSGYSVGVVKKESGFNPILTAEGGIVWICDSCFDKVHKLAKEIFNIIDSEWVYISTLLLKKMENG